VPLSASARTALDQRGATSLEFALVGGLLLSLLLGSMEIGRYMVTLECVRTATAEAVRLATLRGSQNMIAGNAACTNLSGTLAGAGARVPFLQAASLTVTMTGCSTQAGMTTVTIAVAYPFTFTVPIFGASNRPVTETALAIFN
jgi:Flp pilus assembly protein TadG